METLCKCKGGACPPLETWFETGFHKFPNWFPHGKVDKQHFPPEFCAHHGVHVHGWKLLETPKWCTCKALCRQTRQLLRGARATGMDPSFQSFQHPGIPRFQAPRWDHGFSQALFPRNLSTGFRGNPVSRKLGCGVHLLFHSSHSNWLRTWVCLSAVHGCTIQPHGLGCFFPLGKRV